MTELEYTIRAICRRRGVALSKIESVQSAFRCTFGLANGTFLVPVVANTFYYSPRLLAFKDPSGVGNPYFDFGAGPGPSAGNVLGYTSNISDYCTDLEYLQIQYNVSNHTAGTWYLIGSIFKVTYS